MKLHLRRSSLLAVVAGLISLPNPCRANLDFGSDSFNGAPNFTGSLGIASATLIDSFTTEANEPGHRPNGAEAAGRSAWWRWTAPEDGFVCMDTLINLDSEISNPVLNTVLAVYTGNSLLSLQRVAANDDHWLVRTGFYYGLSNVAFWATKGTTYRIAVDAYSTGAISASANRVQLRLRHLPAMTRTRQAIWGDSSDPSLRGALSLTHTTQQSFSAVLTLARRTVRFRGVFDIEGYYRASFERPVPRGSPPLPPLYLEIDGVGGTLKTHDAQQSRAFVECPEVALFSPTSPNPVAGYYTAGAGGTGFVTATIASSGSMRGTVRAPDGSAFTVSSRLTRGIGVNQFFLPLLRFLRNGTGFWSLHTLLADAGTNDDWLAYGTYNRFVRAAAPGATFYPNGLNQSLLLAGGTYTRPAAGQRALDFLDANNGAAVFQLTATPGELASNVAQLLVFSTDNRFDFLSTPLRPSLVLNTRTGLASGGITLSGERRRTLLGVLRRHQNQRYFSGYATGRTQTVPMSVAAP